MIETEISPLPSGVVTFLFTDIEGSTKLWESDPAAMREALVIHDDILNRAIGDNSGTVFKTGGDSFCAVFVDPYCGLNAALEAQLGLQQATWPTPEPVRARMGLHTGTAQVRGEDYFGPTLNRVARLMEAGHGGQVLVSAPTHRLLVDEMPTGVDFASLGTHHLKDLYRPEEVFQVVAEGLRQDFPALRTVPQETPDLGEQARASFQARKWQETVDLLTEKAEESDLSGGEHERMATSLWWLGKHDDLIQHFERAHNAYMSEGDPQNAAIMAIWLAEIHVGALSPDLALAWERKAERVLSDDQDSVAMGYVLRRQTVRAFDIEHDAERALSYSKKALEIAIAHNDGSLETLTLLDQGRIRIAAGDVDEGMALMDEAMVASVSGDVNPVVIGKSYCLMLGVCDKTGDIKRASEWSETAERWCSENESAPYPGVCRIYKAEIMWKKGDWVGAESEVMTASAELGVMADIAGEAWYQYGEMRLRAGDEEGAETAFQEALARGREPVPGYAVLLARRGKIESAIELLDRALAEEALGKLDRARFLPSLAELSLQAGDARRAAEATSELAEIGELARSDLYVAQTSRWKGNIALTEGNTEEALSELKSAVKRLARLGLPYEAALVHADLGRAYQADGADSLAQMEFKVARSELDRLGAQPDVDRVESLMTGSTST